MIVKPAHPVDRKSRRLAIGGGGALAVKMVPSIEAARARGFHVTVIDRLDTPRLCAEHAHLIDEHYNISSEAERNRLLSDALNEPFGLTYVASLPSAHLSNMFDLASVSQFMLVTKPLTTFKHMAALASRFMPVGPDAWTLMRWFLHDHYTTKPIIRAVERILPTSHENHGRYRRMVIVLTEKKTVNEELDRLEALSVGQLPDMGSHAIALLQRLVPKRLTWHDQVGHQITRLDRDIEVRACVELQNHDAPYHTVGSEETVSTAVVLELEVTEHLALEAPGRQIKYDNKFPVLILVGKGFVADPSRTDRDLKAVEVTYDDRATGTIDLESNAGGGVFDPLQSNAALAAARNHRGVNLPLLDLLDRWDRLDRWDGDAVATLGQDFLDAEAAWENMQLQYDAWDVAGRGRRVLGYGSSTGPECVQGFLNAYAVERYGFPNDWHMQKAPLHLMFGSLPTAPTP